MISQHCRLSTLRQVYATKPIKPRAAGAAWRGVPHGLLFGTVVQEIEKYKLAPYSDVRFALSRGGADMACAIPLTGMKSPKGLRPCIGFVSSNAQRKGLCFYAGAVTGDDLPFVIADVDGNESRSWYYTEEFDVVDVVRDAVNRWREAMASLEDDLSFLKTSSADEEITKQFYFDLTRNGVLPWSLMGALDSYWLRCEEKSKWELLRGCGATSHQLPTMAIMQRMRRCYNLLSKK